MARFAHKVVVITGAASGIGEGAVRRFAEEGAALVLGDIDKGALDKLAGELDGAVEIRETDVSDSATCEALVRPRSIALGGSTCWSTTPESITWAKSTRENPPNLPR